MADEDDDADLTDEAGNDGKRDRSTVNFPYMDLTSALEIVSAIYNYSGLSECSTDQIAASMSPVTTPKSGTFRVKISSAKVFGLISGLKGNFKLTERGARAMNPEKMAAALVDAFLGVELYKKVYDAYKGNNLPPTAALEKQLEDFGVSPKQKDRARQVLERSAKQAGFSAIPGRLIVPGLGASNPPPPPKPPSTTGSTGTGGENAKRNLPPFIQGLLEKLPEPDAEWPIADRVKWLQTTAHIFTLMYKGDGEIQISARD